MYKFNWEDLLTEGLLTRLRRATRLPEDAAMSGFKPLLVQVLTSVGGLPVCERDLTSEERTELAARLLHDAARHVLARYYRADTSLGFVLQNSQLEQIGKQITGISRTAVNYAPTEEMAERPMIGKTLAHKITEERTRHGYFSSLEELVNRVDGFGPARAEQIKYSISFDPPSCFPFSQKSRTDFDQAIAELVECCNAGTSVESMTEAVDWLATVCSAEPHPATKHQMIRDFPTVEALDTDAEWIGILDGPEYYEKVPELISKANSSIDVCMFHITLPKEDHPSRRLLDALITAQTRGVKVRVFVDKDAKKDPYLSTIINTPAKRYLEEHNVPCRFDEEKRLLHSKFLVIDSSVVIIGSHNWTAGSYFEFADLSLVISSQKLGQQLVQRFTKLWEGSQ
jgi:hypothetical protein